MARRVEREAHRVEREGALGWKACDRGCAGGAHGSEIGTGT